MKKIINVSLLLWLTGCGIFFSQGYSYYDKMYFQESPYIVKETGQYHLNWVYGRFGFFFQPECIFKAGQALCSLQSTSSSGSLTGRVGYITITNSDVIAAIENNQIYWLGPNNEKVALAVR